MRRIELANLHGRYRVNEKAIRAIAALIFRRVKFAENIRVEAVFLGDGAIKRINRKYLKRDAPTDVISFGLDEAADVFISVDAAFRNSRRFHTSPGKELVLYLIHGILHLSGYDDTAAECRARMKRKEGHLLEEICRRRELSRVLTRR